MAPVVHEQPGPDGYGQVTVLGPDDALHAPDTGLPAFRLRELLNAAER